MGPGENNQLIPVQPETEDATSDMKCTVGDRLGIHSIRWYDFSISPTKTAGELLEYVGQIISYHTDSFQLVLVRKPRTPTLIRKDSEGTLEELGFKMHEKNILEAREMSDNYTAEENLDVSKECTSTHVPPPAPPPYTPGSSSDYLYSFNYSSVINKTELGLIGLLNQAMTCYLNSVIQTLYMTPEFRNALYKWEFDGTEEEGVKSVPYQLQRLFLQMQTSKKAAVGTTQLTTSFGWDRNDAWQQHDVQELCRVMFDALEQKFKNTEQADLISTLYEGKLKDYVKCLECGNESARQDTFLNVPLVVRPFVSSQSYESVEEALEAFVTPEILQGCNQYFCEKCNRKCDAHKGLKFIKFPYMLTLQLKRFDFDPTSGNRIKLNDKVTFPEILNVNHFISEQNIEDAFDVDTIDNGSAPDDEGLCCPPEFPKSLTPISPEGNSDVPDPTFDDEGIDVGANITLSPDGLNTQEANITLSPDGLNTQEINTNEKNLRKSMDQGPYVYELFSIMVHSGNSTSGHYYAYIKSFSDGEWYSFNDAVVSKITYDDIRRTYGGSTRSYYTASAHSSSANAYMLTYRQIDKERNVECMATEEFPDHIKRLLQTMQAQEELEYQKREMDRYMCKIKLFCQHPIDNRMVEMKFKVHRDSNLLEVTSKARCIMGLEALVPLSCCRLVKYNDIHDCLVCSFEGMDEEPIGDILGGAKPNYQFDLLLEIKKPEDHFQEYKPGGPTIKVQIVDLKMEEVLPCRNTLRCDPNETVGGLKNQLAKVLGASANSIRIVFDVIRLLDNNSSSLKSEGFGKTNKIFIEYQDAEDAQVPFLHSRLYSVMESYSYTICIHVALPKVDKTILKKINNYESETDKDDSHSEEEEKISASNGTQNGCSMGHIFSKENINVYKKSKLKSRKNDVYKSEIMYFDSEFCNLVTRQSNPGSLYLSESKKLSSGVELSKKYQTPVTPEDSSQDGDEGLGENEMGFNCLPINYTSYQAVHSDQSEDSSLTDSERTLVGDDFSPRNNSPDIMGTEIESDNDTTHRYSPADIDCLDSTNNSDSNVQTEFGEENEEEISQNMKFSSVFDSSSDSLNDKSQNTIIKRYFRAWPYTDCETGEKMLRVYVDKRIILDDLKRELEPYVKFKKERFKIYRVYSDNQEFECTALKENIMTFSEDLKLVVKLQWELRKGEYRVKIYQLKINENEPVKELMDWILLKGMTVLYAKKEILPEIKDMYGLDIPLNRCRLRKKSWKNPGVVFLDTQQFGIDIPIHTRSSNWEMFLEVLEDAEIVSSITNQLVFIRKWSPSSFETGPLQEVIIDPVTVESLKEKIFETSGIPKDCIEFAKGPGTFPCEVSIMSIHTELEWISTISTPNRGLSLTDDGIVIYYRDSREQLKKLTKKEKELITSRECVRSYKNTRSLSRKEKALKIYASDDSSNKSNRICDLVKNVCTSSPVVPDLD